MRVNFTKMHGLGNDYIYFDCIANPELISCPEKIAPALSDRHFGIGGDGIVLILKHDIADFRMRMFNADGSEAEMCGNAIRCVAKYLCDNGYCDGDQVRIQTGAGIMEIAIKRDKHGNFELARVNMGKPVLKGPAIPVNIDLEPVKSASIALNDDISYQMTCVSMGNPHAVIFVDKITDEQVLLHGPMLEKHQLFPKRSNIEFVKVLSRNEIEMRVWERGSGETLACGTGASAVTVAAILNQYTDSKVTVHLRGGDLLVEWADNGHVYMTGPAAVAFTGNVDI